MSDGSVTMQKYLEGRGTPVLLLFCCVLRQLEYRSITDVENCKRTPGGKLRRNKGKEKT